MSLIKAIEKVDAGDVYLVKKLKLNGNELYDEIRKKEASLMIKMILQFLKAYPSKNCSKQKGKSIFFRKRTPMDSKLDINKSLKKLFPLLRIANNEDWPAFFYYKNKKYKIKIYKYDN